jgi:ATP-dependent Lhr-like helicase
MALIKQEGAASRRFDDSTIRRAIGQTGQTVEDLIDYMLNQEILFEDSGIIGIGPRGEKLYGAKNFMALMSVFDTPSLFQIVCGIEELGWVHPLSFAGLGQRPVIISLGGRAWEVIRLDEDRSLAYVRAAEAPGRSRWLGGNRALSSEFCGAVRLLLLDEATDDLWSKRAATEMAAARLETFAVRLAGRVVESDTGTGRTTFWTFAGLKANYSLALMLKTQNGVIPRFDNYFVEIPGPNSVATAEQILQHLASSTAPLFDANPPGRVKFWDCLSGSLRRQFSTSRLLDYPAALNVLAQKRIHLGAPGSDRASPHRRSPA